MFSRIYFWKSKTVGTYHTYLPRSNSMTFHDLDRNSMTFQAWNPNYQIAWLSRFSRTSTNPASAAHPQLTLSGYPCGLLLGSWSIPPPIRKPHRYRCLPSASQTGVPWSVYSGSLFRTIGICDEIYVYLWHKRPQKFKNIVFSWIFLLH